MSIPPSKADSRAAAASIRELLAKSQSIARNKRKDVIARWVITGGGLVTIISVIGVLLLIIRVALPLFGHARADKVYSSQSSVGEASSRIVALGMDEYVETAFLLDDQGRFSFLSLQNGRLLDTIETRPVDLPDGHVVSVDAWGKLMYSILWSDGSASVVRVEFLRQFDDKGNRAVTRSATEVKRIPLPDGASEPIRSVIRIDSNEGVVRVDQMAGNRLSVSQETTTEDLFGNKITELKSATVAPPDNQNITALALDVEGKTLYAGTKQGRIVRWGLGEPGALVLLDNIAANAEGIAITSLGLVFGDVSIAVGCEDGSVTTWFPVSSASGQSPKSLAKIHTLTPHKSRIVSVMGSRRDKTLASLDSEGVIHVDHMTSERNLLRLACDSAVRQMCYSARANGMVALDDSARLTAWRLDVSHPEVSARILFGKVWYEGYDKPEYVWQSSSSTDDSEPKLSIAPLVFGSLKGTIYAMIFAVPLALLGAMYTSQFTSPVFRGYVKPIMEVMAAIPSVVIGFIAALWLAPIIERHIISFFLFLITLPTIFVVFILIWTALEGAVIAKVIEKGYEFVAVAPVILIAGWLAYALGPFVDGNLFDGEFNIWLFQQTGQRYDQRNCVVISFALGFTVIPLIFTLAEDALSNIPHSLKAASLALGASRWQTVWRVVLPSASPGIFAAIIIGLGRAVGETMIVLMATGNTPIMDASIFNGMRTLSANIAVEIPEAPQNGTLYRVLFLSAVLLMLLTSVLNTAAELVRQRLKRKYGQY